MRFISIILFVLLSTLSFSYEISDFPYKSRYDEKLKYITDEKYLSEALDDSDLDIVFSALKRVGELKLTNLKSKVIGLIAVANPQANQDKPKLLANYRNIFYLGILVIGKIGNGDDDAPYLTSFLRDTKKDPLATSYILMALGEFKGNKKALDFLQEYSLLVNPRTDSRVVRALVDAIVAHGNKKSNVYLIKLKKNTNKEDQSYIDEAIDKLRRSK
ncbi:MAG: hypothetical protein N2258_02365 [Brevinematales bacterium]|nr:hypothetical protein [Brevinematales bacterium]